MSNSEEEYIKLIRNKSDSYERTIQAIIAFDSAVRFDDSTGAYVQNSHFLPGRKFTKANGFVTPDLGLQISKDYGIVSEVKITASSQADFQAAHDQIKKYDEDLVGWKTPDKKIKLHDLALVTNDFAKVDAKEFFAKKTFSRKFALVTSVHVSEAVEKIKIEKYEGSFSDTRIDNKLKRPLPIPLEKILSKISTVKFYDAEPPVEYTMNVLWMSAFNEITSEGSKTKKEIQINCDDLVKRLSDRFSFPELDSTQERIPKKEWIVRALEFFVKLGYGHKDPKNSNIYNIKYASSNRKDSMLELFAKKMYNYEVKRKKKGNDDSQLSFLSEGVVT